MVFGRLMFAPDSTYSRGSTRVWGVSDSCGALQTIFRHRSRWSHGIVFGTLIRVVYFAAVLTLLVWAGVYIQRILCRRHAAGLARGRARVASSRGAASYGVGRHVILATLGGLWWGAASHTLADVGWSVVRKGSEIF